MNNEYESGRYGTHLKYFQSLDDYNDYLDSSTTVKARPNVAYCDGNIKYVKYNWENDTVVLSAASNPTVYKILTAANIEPSTSEGFTISDLAAITLDDIYCQNPGSGGFESYEEGFVSGGWAELTPEERTDLYDNEYCSRGYSIFFCYGNGDGGGDMTWASEWEFPEFQYFTGITSIPNDMFRNCKGLTSITIPSSVTYIDVNAFCNCYSLTNITILNSQNNVSIVDYNYNDEDYSSSAFAYTGFIPNGDYEDEQWGEDYNSPLDRVKSEGILIFQP